MRKIILALIICICGVLSALLLIRPVVVYASSCSAVCSDGSVQSISSCAGQCVGIDGNGAYCSVGGKVVLAKACNVN